jgi:hydroxymethylglutaryl-CoA lyase
VTGPEGLPARHPLAGLPREVRVFEVGARDGLQNEPGFVPTDVKAEFIERLVGAGLRTVEATSFVSPRWVPQLGDAEELYGRLSPHPGVRYPVLVPNQAGLERALACGVSDISVFASATETFSRRNLNRTIDESLAAFAPVVTRARAEGVAVRGYLSMCFGDPWEGAVAIEAVVALARRLVDMGCADLSVGDTIGVATPGHVAALIEALVAAGISVDRIGVHFHDTYGQALANTIAALQQGVTTVDASAGGLGGCPFAKSATGNLATEDLIWALDGLGVQTGVDLRALVATSAWMADLLGRPSPSRVVTALRSVPAVSGQAGAEAGLSP